MRDAPDNNTPTPSARPIRRVLVRAPNWIGDAVMATPALRSLRQIFPDARIDVLCRPGVAPIFQRHPAVDRVVAMDEKKSPVQWVRGALRLRSEKYDLGVLAPNSLGSALFLFLVGPRRRVGYARDGRGPLLTDRVYVTDANRQGHLVAYYQNLLLPLSQNAPGDGRLTLEAGDKDRRAVRALLEELGAHDGDQIIGLNPGAAYGTAKRWLPERYREVAAHFGARPGTRVLVGGSAAEADLCDAMADGLGDRVHAIAGRLALGPFIALVERMDAFVSNDSGAMHIAAALGRPQVAIFGPTDWVATAPRSDRAVVLRHPVDCAPCMLRECPLDEHLCMIGVSTESVIAAVENQLADRVPERNGVQA